MILKVMAGDSYNIRVASGWSSASSATNSPTNVLTDLLNLLSTGAAGVSGGKATSAQLQATNSGLNAGLTSFMGTQTTGGTKPKAYINWILLDEQFKVVPGESGFQQVGASGATTIHTRTNISINKSGYLYVYTSNEATNIDVYFDNLQVTHIRGALLETNEYYPFGLLMQNISYRALKSGYRENKFKFNSYEQQNKEFSDGSGLEWYDYKHRFYDNQIGRFFCIDAKAPNYPYYTPYQFAGNQVTVAIDLDGDEPKYMIDGNGHLTNPMKSLLHAAFGYSMNAMNRTTWKPSDIQFAEAITIFRTVSYNRYLSSRSDGYWAGLIAHEQNHRDEIGNDIVGAANWYLNYGIGYVGAGFSYEKDPSEVRAYANGLGRDSRMGKLLNFGGGVALKVFQGNFDDNAKSETLNFIGLAFNLSEETERLNTMQGKLDSFTGSDKAKNRLEKRIARQEKAVNAVSQQVQKAITDTVVNTLDDVNKPKN